MKINLAKESIFEQHQSAQNSALLVHGDGELFQIHAD